MKSMMLMLAVVFAAGLMLTTGCKTCSSCGSCEKPKAAACTGACCKDPATCKQCCGDAAGCAKCCKK